MFTYHDSLETIPSGAVVIGVEATRPEHRARCAVNIDPQHGGGGAAEAAEAILPLLEMEGEEVAYRLVEEPDERCAATLMCDVPLWAVARDLAFLTSRPDLDSVAAMAIASMMEADNERNLIDSGDPGLGTIPVDDAECGWRLGLIAEADCFVAGQVPWRPSRLPTLGRPWGEGSGSVDSRMPLAAINAACFDRTVPLAKRVETVRNWLLTGEEPAEYRERVEAQRLRLLREANIAIAAPDIATVTVDLPGATGLGYCLAPTVVCEAPNFRPVGGRKFTVAFWTPPAPYQALVAALNLAEEAAGGDPAWGGNPTSGIMGSSQARPSALTLEQVVQCVRDVIGPPMTQAAAFLARIDAALLHEDDGDLFGSVEEEMLKAVEDDGGGDGTTVTIHFKDGSALRADDNWGGFDNWRLP